MTRERIKNPIAHHSAPDSIISGAYWLAAVIKKVPRPIDPKGLGAPSARLCAAGCGVGRMA